MELRASLERYAAPRRARTLDAHNLSRRLGTTSIDDAWSRLAARPALFTLPAPVDVEALTPGETARIVASADAALERRVDLLGSGPVELPTPTEWTTDFTSGRRWDPGWARSIPYRFADDSDVKIVWELSRLNWLLPAGQAFVLTGDDRYAAGVRAIVEEWLAANPYGMTVNWSVPIEPSLRVCALVWLFYACNGSRAWSDAAFRADYLRALFLHVDYVDRNIEWSEPRGNHYTANLAALVLGGLFFDETATGRRWAERGWSKLTREIRLQVLDDGVDFEASSAYHRLVAELLLVPALCRLRRDESVSDEYRDRLAAMGRFAAAYLRPDGTAPAWGDEDDARVLPLDGLPPRDHRYLPGLIGALLGRDELCYDFGAPRSQTVWLAGADAARSLRAGPPPTGAGPTAFRHGGVVVLRTDADHVFVDCGPVGLAGRGGHGHNDSLSFEAVLGGEPLVVDPGTYAYTRSSSWRNHFRSTAAHNTPMVDGVEQARVDDASLWRIEPDADGEILDVSRSESLQRFIGRHRGYRRLASPVVVTRTIELDARLRSLTIRDEFDGAGLHAVVIPIQLAPGARLRPAGEWLELTTSANRYRISWTPGDAWACTTDSGWVSPSYGIKVEGPRIEWRREGRLAPLLVRIEHIDAAPSSPPSGR